MKKLLIVFMMISFANAQAHIDFEGSDSQPTEQEILKNRACFEELAKLGCGDPGEDVKQFRSCLHQFFPTLNQDCKKLMSNLYGGQ